MWCQNGTENFIIYHKITLNTPFLIYDFSAAPLLFKIGTFCVPTEVESGFSVKISTVPSKSGRLKDNERIVNNKLSPEVEVTSGGYLPSRGVAR